MPDDNTLPTSSPASSKPTPNLEDEKERARQAMEGAERTAKRESEEKAKVIQGQLDQINTRLEQIRAEKEKFELAWINLDDQRRQLRKVLDPILAEEKQIEDEETKLEEEESRVGVPAEKHEVEKKRWTIQAKRKEIEEKKWSEEEKVSALDKTINDNTVHYRQLLDEEDKLETQAEQIKSGETHN